MRFYEVPDTVLAFTSDSDGKQSAYNVGDLGSVPELGRSPAEGHGNPLQNSCLENPHGQRNLVGYSPWGCKQLDTTEQLSTAQDTVLSTLVASLSLLFMKTLLGR